MGTHTRALGRFIARRREELQLTQSEVAAELGYKGPQFISNIERGLAGLPIRKYRRLASALRVSLGQLLEETLEPSELEDARIHFGLGDPLSAEPGGAAHTLPLLAEVECNQFTWAESFEDAPEQVSVPFQLYRAGRFLLKAHGDSMRNEIKQDDICVFDPVVAPRTGQIVCAQLTGETEGSTIKWYIDHGPYVELRPENLNKLYHSLMLVRSGGEFLLAGRERVQLLIKGVLVGLMRRY